MWCELKHQVWITPLTCASGTGQSALMEWDERAFEERSTAAIYCKDPEASWFRMKTTEHHPSLEPVLYGVRGGDLVTVHFDALVRKGEGSIAVDVLAVTPRYETSLLVTNELPVGALDTYFKRFSIPYLLQLAPECIGIVLRIRPTGAYNEVIIKSLSVEVDTDNTCFSMSPSVLRYDHIGDYLNCIRAYSMTDIDPSYNSLYTLFNEGNVAFPDEQTIAFRGDTSPRFRGLMGLFPTSKYRTPLAVYLEYRNTNDVPGLALRIQGFDAFNRLLATERYELPLTSDWRRALWYTSGADFDGACKLLVTVGDCEKPLNMELRRVRFASARFDDAPKGAPNQLEAYFSDLGYRLRTLVTEPGDARPGR